MGATRKLPPPFLFSLVIHAGLLLVWGIFATRQQSIQHPKTPEYVMIEVDPLPKVNNRDSKNQQVVQTERGPDARKAKEDAFLGERTQVVDEQKMSIPKTGDSAASSKGSSKKEAVAQTTQSEPPAPKATARGAMIQSTGALARFGIAIDASKDYAPKPKAMNPAEEASLSAQARGEYVKGFKEGEQTLLNTKEYVFYGYFQRLRQNLDRAWEKSLRDQLAKYFHRGRQLASEMDYTTQLLVSLDSKGRVIRVRIIGQSGTRDLDQAAVKAFNEAGPFPNPPQGLIDKGELNVRWDFVLKT